MFWLVIVLTLHGPQKQPLPFATLADCERQAALVRSERSYDRPGVLTAYCIRRT